MIDVKRTNARFDEKCVSRHAWARSKGINPTTFYQRLSGKYSMPEHFVELLREDGLLVEKGDE